MSNQDDSADSGMHTAEAQILAAHLSALRSEQRRMADTLQEVSRSLTILTRIEMEQQHQRRQVDITVARVDNHEQRVQAMEREIPPLMEMRKWVIAGILAGVGMMGTGLVKMVLIDGKPSGPVYSGKQP